MNNTNNHASDWQTFYRIGGIAAVLAVLVGIVEVGLSFFPGGSTANLVTVTDWFNLFQENWFMGLRNLGLLNIALNICGIFFFVALYGALQTTHRAWITLAVVLYIIGVSAFFATNRAFPMLELSQQYAVATSASERATLEAAGQAMLSVGRSHSTGTFMAFMLTELAAIVASLVVLASDFSSKRVIGLTGLFGFGLLMIYEIASAFIPGQTSAAMIVSMVGGILSMIWYTLMARNLWKLGASTD